MSHKIEFFTKADLDEFINQDVCYCQYLHPTGTSSAGDGLGRYSTEIEEAKLIKVTDTMIHLETKFKNEEYEYTDVNLVPLAAIIEIRVQTHYKQFKDGV